MRKKLVKILSTFEKAKTDLNNFVVACDNEVSYCDERISSIAEDRAFIVEDSDKAKRVLTNIEGLTT